MKQLKANLFLFLLLLTSALHSQQALDLPKRFDYGKMWTFEHPPKEWLKEAYQYDLDDAWYDKARMSALKFASWCSASFVSPNGLIMTNHHCSRGVVGELMKEGENFDETGFYAPTLKDERRKDDLFVEQLVQVADITNEVNSQLYGLDDATRQQKTKAVLDSIKEHYANQPQWSGMRLQVVSYYSGGQYSLYGYKRYNDIRLVMIPELASAYFGGDYDNFTYPRYNLDVTFWRAYDDEGNPLNTSAFYFPFNPDGVHEGTPTFVIGNPGRTERYRTYAQLQYDKDYRYPMLLTFLKNRHALLQEEYDRNPSHALQERMFGISNSIKAISGIVDGLNSPHLMARKRNMEQDIRYHTPKEKQYIWDELEATYKALEPHTIGIQLLGDNPLRGQAVHLTHLLYKYEMAMKQDPKDSVHVANLHSSILEAVPTLNSEKEQKNLTVFLKEIQQFEHPDAPLASKILRGRKAEEVARNILENTQFNQQEKAKQFLDMPPELWRKSNDPLLRLGRVIVPAYESALDKFKSSSARRKALEVQVANAIFKVKGKHLPPDATFTLRIADGVVKGYNYNGTKAPFKTTYYGLYDRHYSFDQKAPWNLGKMWENPSMELLKSPMNFITTNDIIGGNSGSPMINVKHEAIGLIFDGNIESLPGNFIYDDESNRTVAVHAGGIIAALRYVYRAEPLVLELLQHYNAGINETDKH